MPECGKCHDSIHVPGGLEFRDGIDFCHECRVESRDEFIEKLKAAMLSAIASPGAPIMFRWNGGWIDKERLAEKIAQRDLDADPNRPHPGVIVG